MEHQFNIDIAQKYGVNEAIFLNNIAYWLIHNKANNRHFHEGRHWTYNTQKAFIDLFPYWSRQNLRTIIKNCIDKGLILKGNFNQIAYDHTSWYTLSDLGLTLFPRLTSIGWNQPISNDAVCEASVALEAPSNVIGWNQPIKGLEPTTLMVETNQPIPDINTDNKQNIRERGATKEKARALSPLSQDFKINEENQKLLKETVQKSGKSENDLLLKFKSLMKIKDIATREWQARLAMFLIDEKPISQLSNVCKPTKEAEPSRYGSMRDFTQERLDREKQERLLKTSNEKG